MSLEIKIEDGHFIAHDGCNFNRAKSNISRAKHGERIIGEKVVSTFRSIDEIKRRTGNQSVLYKAGLGIVHKFYEDGHRIELQCPSCENKYELGRDQFKIGEDAYQEAIKKPDVYPDT